jgi:transketolase
MTVINTKQTAINTLRLLCADAVQKANSGHPGLPLGAAPMAFELWEGMRHNPANPDWLDRDRFILSAGHGSTLIYGLLHMFGYEDSGAPAVSMDDLKQFRQLGSKTPGHPEYGHTKGVEITTGPLGQGIANAVGMAMAEAHLAAKFNRPGHEIVNHHTYALCGDGCLQEGVASEACSLAGTLGLGKLIILYDSNNITIEGDTAISFTEDVLKRYEAYGWHTQFVADGNDTAAIRAAIDAAKAAADKPSIIEIKTKIGYGSPNKQGKASSHGEPLGADELKLTKQYFGFDPDKDFHVPDDVMQYMANVKAKTVKLEGEWNVRLYAYEKAFPDLYKEWLLWNEGGFTADLLNLDELWIHEGDTATRLSSEKILNIICKHTPNIIGGSADLAPSNKTVMKGLGDYSKDDYLGRNLHFGIREHAMTAIANGIIAHGGLRCFVATFFVFCDYMKPAMRMSALMGLPVISVLTHDSIGVGEDGATHQPIEQLAMLRSIPNHTVIRPCDTNETAAAWYLALTRKDSPTAIVLTRQNTMLLKESGKAALKGGYIVRDSDKATPDIILIASGSEVELIYKAKDALKEKGIDARVVSMPSFEVFEEQTDEYKESVLPKMVTKRLAVEAASSFGWHKYAGEVISMDTYGASGPAGALFKKFGFTVENVVEKAERLYR